MTGPIAPALADSLISRFRSHADLDLALQGCTSIELAALWHDWEFWARPAQLAPEGSAWRSWGALTGRGWGKTRAFSEFVNREAASGRAMRIALMAQTETKAWEVLIEGESGLLATSAPWFKARAFNGRVMWPNGAQAFVYTPESPGGVFGPEHHLGWASEIHYWPKATREDAFRNLRLGLRLGYGRLVWDSNPRRGHPIIRFLLERGERDPVRHVVVRGATYENAANLTAGAIEEWEQEFGRDTAFGRQMLLGEQIDDEEGALVKAKWITDNRRSLPDRLVRRALAIDPAISTRRGTDPTGIMDVGLGEDGQLYVIEDLSGRHAWEAWGTLVVTEYMRRKCDCVIVERNRGGDACVANLRAAAKDAGVSVVELDGNAMTRNDPRVIYVKQVISRSGKVERAEPVAGLYERGRVSHVKGADLETLEEQWTSYEPAPNVESPNALDACVFAVWELADLGRESKDPRMAFAGLLEASRALSAPVASPGLGVIPGGGTGGLLTGGGVFGGGDGWGGGL